MSPRCIVRPALGGDLMSVLGVLAQNQADSPSDGVPSKLQDVASDKQLAMWERIQASPDCRPAAFVEAVVVAYAHRRQGVATLVLERLLMDARAAGCYKVQLLSHKRHANDGAHDLYAGLGFVPEAEGFRHYLT